MSETAESNPIGRPRAISSPEVFDMLVDTYINACKENNQPIILTGLILSLGLNSKESFYQYEKYPEFSDSVKRARLFVESAYEIRLANGSNAAAPIFALKNFGWTDKQEIEMGGVLGLAGVPLTDAQRKTLDDALDKDV